jgi:hypothetical protein
MNDYLKTIFEIIEDGIRSVKIEPNHIGELNRLSKKTKNVFYTKKTLMPREKCALNEYAFSVHSNNSIEANFHFSNESNFSDHSEIVYMERTSTPINSDFDREEILYNTFLEAPPSCGSSSIIKCKKFMKFSPSEAEMLIQNSENVNSNDLITQANPLMKNSYTKLPRPQHPLAVQSVVKIVIFHANSPHRMWFCEYSDVKKMYKIMHRMQEFYAENATPPKNLDCSTHVAGKLFNF